MEEEIDLRPYIAAVLRRWRLIVLIVALAVAVAVIVVLMRPQEHTASGDVLILPSRSQLAFDERYVTSNTILGTDITSRRQALLALADSPALEEAARAKLPTPNSAQGLLASRIRVGTDGDLLHIEANAADDQSAQQIAAAWTEAYVQIVNDLYGKNTTLIQQLEQQQTEAQGRYDTAEKELETFLASSSLVRVSQQISVTVDLLDQSRIGTQKLYEQYLTQARDVEATIRDAETLREQVSAGHTEGLATSLAALALRARTSSEAVLPVDLRFDNPGELTQANNVTVADLDALIAVLRQRRDALMEQSQQLAQAVSDGKESGGLSPELDQTYAQRLSELNRQYEQQKAQRDRLQQRRDLAAESLVILQRKIDEQRVAGGAPEIQVRYLTTSIVPPRSVISRAILYAVAAAAAAFIFGIFLVIILTIIQAKTPSRSPQPHGERPLDQPTTG
jgi:capsular polysaccharide biosynthesis protein